MRPAAQVLLDEAVALRPILLRTPAAAFNRPTVCDGWSVRDVLSHCAAVLTHVIDATVHGFTPADNQHDVDVRRGWSLPAVLDELETGYRDAALAIDAAGGRLDGVGIGEWIHGGDVRDALGEPDAYVSDGIGLAFDLLLDRSRLLERPGIAATIDGETYGFGTGEQGGAVATDLETFMRLTSGRRPEPDRSVLEGCTEADFRLFS